MRKFLFIMYTLKLPALVVLLVFTGLFPIFALDVTFTAPGFSGPGAGLFQDWLDNIFDEFEALIKDEIKDIKSNPKELIQGFSNASVFSSDGASQRAYGGYKTFAVTGGVLAAVQLPFSIYAISDEIKDMEQKLKSDGAYKFGFSLQPSVQIGINTSRFLLKNLYLSLKGGFFNLTIKGGDDLDIPFLGYLSLKSFSFGAMGNYQLLPQKKLLAGFFLWRGINIGTGFIYNRTNLDFSMALDAEEKTDDYDSHTITVKTTPKFDLGFNMSTIRMPIEVMTSIRFLWVLNLAVGAGVDFGFGSTELKALGSANVSFEGLETLGLTQIQAGRLSVDMGGKEGPAFINPKLMGGFGVTIGPVLIDIPFTWYFLDGGYNFGLTIGAVW